MAKTPRTFKKDSNDTRKKQRHSRVDELTLGPRPDDLTNVLGNTALFPTDLVIRVKGGRAFNCHKSVMQSRTSYFKGLVNSGWKDSDSVTMDDVLPDEMDWLIKSLYRNEPLYIPTEADRNDDDEEEEEKEKKKPPKKKEVMEEEEEEEEDEDDDEDEDEDEEGQEGGQEDGEAVAPLVVRVLVLVDRLGALCLLPALQWDIRRAVSAANALPLYLVAQRMQLEELENTCRDFIEHWPLAVAAAMRGSADPEQALAFIRVVGGWTE